MNESEQNSMHLTFHREISLDHQANLVIERNWFHFYHFCSDWTNDRSSKKVTKIADHFLKCNDRWLSSVCEWFFPLWKRQSGFKDPFMNFSLLYYPIRFHRMEICIDRNRWCTIWRNWARHKVKSETASFVVWSGQISCSKRKRNGNE